MNENLNGLVVVLTGGGGGIGCATAQRLHDEGARIALLGGTRPEKLEETRAKLGGDCLVYPGDLTCGDTIRQGLQAVADTWGGIDVLINNAGMALSCPFEEVTEEQFDRIMAINIRTPFFLTQAALPYLRKSQRASIINLSSVVGHAGYPLQTAYAASKHAILGFTKSLANEVYRDGIRVHAICPGGVYTEMVKVARPDLTPEGMIQPEEIADIIAFFLLHRGNAVVDEIKVHRVNKEPFLI